MDTQSLTISLSADYRWIPLIRNVVLDFGHASGFAQAVTEMSANAILECVEEYVRACRDRSVEEPFSLILESGVDALSICMSYPMTIPLNPTQQEDYEIPDVGADLNSLDVTGLWLHLVKKNVDRVYFRRNEDSHSLHLIKYRRDPGKIRQFWVMGLSPCLIGDVNIDQKTGEGPTGGILQHPRSPQVIRLDPVTMYVLKRLDGKTTFWQIYLDCVDHVGIITPQKLGAIYVWLEESGLLEGMGLDQKKSNRVLDFFEKLLALDYGTRSADRLVTAIYRRIRFLFHPASIIVGAMIILSAFLPALWQWQELLGMGMKLDKAVFQNPYLALTLYLVLMFAVVVHEMGHGLTCKHFGGRVDRFGVMLYLVMFIFYCDVSTAWNFPRKRDRILVSLAGPFTSIFLASVCFWTFYWTPAGYEFIRLVTGVTGLFLTFLFCMNFNPFLKLDGYYMLMDAVECPNLRPLAFQFIRTRLLGRKGKDGFDPARLPTRLKRLFWFYGLGGILVTALFIIRPVWFVTSSLLSDRSGTGRLFLTCVILLLVLMRMTVRAVRASHDRRNQSWKLS